MPEKEELKDYLDNRFHKKVINILNKDDPTNKDESFFVNKFWEDITLQSEMRQKAIHEKHTGKANPMICPCNKCIKLQEEK